MAILRCQAIYTFIVSYLFFGGDINIYKIIGICLVILGLFIIVFNTEKWELFTVNVKKGKIVKNSKNSKNNLNFKINNITWIILALVAGIFVTGKDFYSKEALLHPKSSIMNILYNQLISQTILAFFYKLYKTGNLYLQDTNNDDKTDKTDYKYVLITTFFFVVYSFLLLLATEYAPNIGYIKSIDTLSIVITIILSKYIFNTSVNYYIWFGIILILVGVFLVI